MRYTAFAATVVGVVATCYAGYQYATGGPPAAPAQCPARSLT